MDLAHDPVLCMAVYRAPNGINIIVTLDNTPNYGPLLHASMSHRRRDPYWEEIKAMRETFFPADLDVMMVLPREADYVNVHEHCFHLWETPQPWALR